MCYTFGKEDKITLGKGKPVWDKKNEEFKKFICYAKSVFHSTPYQDFKL